MIRKFLAGSALALALAVPAQAAEKVVSPLDEGWYLAPMATWTTVESEWNADDSLGGSLAIGRRFGAFALEANVAMTEFDSEVMAEDMKLRSAGANLLVFPLQGFNKWLRGVYALGGAAFVDADNVTYLSPNNTAFTFDENTHYLQGGLGYLLPLSIGRYDFGVRLEALARRTEEFDEPEDRANGVPANDAVDGVYSLGLQLPLGLRPIPPPPPPPAPVAVVKPLSICADGQDNDGDGKTDYPADPGCSSADDDNETDPPQCSDGKDNDGDGLIDYPDDKGCETASDNDEEDPCKTPTVGERVSLKGCGTGDVIVLRGVNFDFDKSTLTANAKSILDDVSGELNAYPSINVELSGHTDAKGSDSYNQSLSDRRAASVRRYLVSKGVAGSRMTSVGYGESQPVADNETDEGREINRRVELKVTSGVGKPVESEEGPSFDEQASDEVLQEDAPPAADGDYQEVDDFQE